MAAITDLVARYSGMLAYTDGSVGYFHVQLDGLHETPYSVDSAGSHQTQINVCWADAPGYTYYVHQIVLWMQTQVFSALNIVTTETAITNTPSGARFAVFHLEILASMDDGSTLPFSATFENDDIHVHVRPDQMPTIDNGIEAANKLMEMLQLMDQTAVYSL